MEAALIATKVRIPVSTGGLERPRLIGVLEAGLPGCRLALVAAPAGYGKTTLLAQWARASRYPVAWVSIDGEENDPERFLRYLYRAWAVIRPEIQESSLAALLEGSRPDLQAALADMINLAGGLAGHTAFVLDDYHLIGEPAVHEMMAYLLDHLPDTVHFVLAARAEPPLPVSRLRVRGALLELGPADLRFSAQETADFLNRLQGLALDPAQLNDLQNRLEGWAAGLRLASFCARRRPPGDCSPLLSGAHRFVGDYLSQDVLAGLPEDRREFLLQTSILEPLCGALCDAVTGGEGGQAALEQAERENLFLFALDETRTWFRYHRLFADFLRAELKRRSPELLPELHRRAARWFLEADMPERAFRHALAAGDRSTLGLVFERYMNARLPVGEHRLLKDWLDRVPPDWFKTYPALSLARAGYLAYTGSMDDSMRVVDEVEKQLAAAKGDDVPFQRAAVKAIRCFMACMRNDVPQAETYARQALRELPADALGFRPGIYGALGDTYRQNGRWQAADECYRKALSYTRSPAVRVMAAHIYGALADMHLLRGRLRQAAAFWQQALASIQAPENWGRLPLGVSGWVYIRMAELSYEWDALEQAGEQLARGMERAELGGDLRTQAVGWLLQARIHQARGELAPAAAALDRARRLLEQDPFPEWETRVERCQVEQWLAAGRLKEAARWAADALTRPAPENRIERERLQLAAARALGAQNDPSALDQARALLEQTLAPAEEEGRAGIVIEALALSALIQAQAGSLPGALTALERALRLAEPEGCLRLFADLGPGMERLLRDARSRGVLPAYTARLIEACGGIPGAAAAAGRLAEPLSPREQEILALVAAGLTNREIADRLVISPETVKKHVSSITGKLGAANRTEAAARARSLGMLD